MLLRAQLTASLERLADAYNQALADGLRIGNTIATPGRVNAPLGTDLELDAILHLTATKESKPTARSLITLTERRTQPVSSRANPFGQP